MKLPIPSLLICLILLLPGGSLSAAEQVADILLLNTNAAIEKYRTAQEEYQKAVPHTVSNTSIEGFPGDISELYRDIARTPYRLIYCIGTRAYLAALKHAPEKTILFSSIINWRRLPQGDHVYGIANELHPTMHLAHFKTIFPRLKTIGVLYAREFNEQWIALAKESAAYTGISLVTQSVTDMAETRRALQKLLPEIEAFWMIPDPMIISSRNNLIDVIQDCDQHRVPVFSYNELYAPLGVTLIISADESTVGRQAAMISRDLLSGRPPRQKVQLPAGSAISLNLKKVKDFNIPYNPASLEMINQIFEQPGNKNKRQ